MCVNVLASGMLMLYMFLSSMHSAVCIHVHIDVHIFGIIYCFANSTILLFSVKTLIISHHFRCRICWDGIILWFFVEYVPCLLHPKSVHTCKLHHLCRKAESVHECIKRSPRGHKREQTPTQLACCW